MGRIKNAFGTISLIIYYIAYMLAAFVIATAAFYLITFCLQGDNDNLRIVNIESQEQIDKLNSETDGFKIIIPADKDGAVDVVLIYAADNYVFIMYPLLLFAAITLGTVVFYRRKLKKPIKILLDAADSISADNLDFRIDYKKNDMMGKLCGSFESMRNALYQNNIRTWRMIDEMRRAQSAFSHDLRTPMTVIQGYTDYLEMYIPEGKVPPQKLLDTVKKIGSNIKRLINFTVSMSTLNKIDSMEIKAFDNSVSAVNETIRSDADMLCGGKTLVFSSETDCERAKLDSEIIIEAAENLISNAARYAKTTVFVDTKMEKGIFKVTVRDDGPGFSKEALQHGTEAYFTEGTGGSSANFGIGLSVCQTLCKKYSGSLTLANTESGAQVTATFDLTRDN